MNDPAKPRFQHDCPSCLFLGHSDGADLYFCRKDRLTVTARRGDGPAHVETGLIFSRARLFTTVARGLAVKAGLYRVAS